VISPLLANVYLHLVDRNFRQKTEKGVLCGRLIRYADDLVILTPRAPDRERRWLENILSRLGLGLHPEKTQQLDARVKDFDFLGHTLRWRYERKLYLDISAKALNRIRAELRYHTRQTGRDLPAMVAALNPYIRGVRQYFRRVVRRRVAKLDRFAVERIARWWRRKHGRAVVSWWLVRGSSFWSKHGLDRFYVRRVKPH